MQQHLDHMKRSSALILGLFTIAGCVTTQERLQQYVGTHKNRLIGEWGPAEHKEPDGKGGEIWIYQKTEVWTTPRREEVQIKKDDENQKAERTIKVYPEKVRKTIHNTSFYIGKDGVIYDTAHGSRRVQ